MSVLHSTLSVVNQNLFPGGLCYSNPDMVLAEVSCFEIDQIKYSDSVALFQDDLIQSVVVPHFAHIDTEPDAEVRVRTVQLLVDLGMSCQTPCCLDILELIRKVSCHARVRLAQSAQSTVLGFLLLNLHIRFC